jgi:hypothetical protein
VLPLLLPLAATLPLSVPLLNTTPFAPASAAEDLAAGALQLPAGAALLLSEAALAEGTLGARGASRAARTRSQPC